MEFKKILAPTDLSQLSKDGVRHALNLARSFGGEVTVYHVINYDEIMGYSREITTRAVTPPAGQLLESYQRALKQFLEHNFSDLLPLVEVRQKVEMGSPAKNIVERAQAEGADLIVISTHGRTGLSHMLMGSVTEKVVRMSRCPVLSIHPRPEETVGSQKTQAA